MADNNNQVATISKVNLPNVLELASLTRELKHVRSVGDALTLASDRYKYPSLAVMRRDHGNEVVEDLIMAYLVDMRKKINAKRHLSDGQIEEIAFEVVNTYYHFTIADIHLVFKWAKLGKYGELYESIDMPKVMGWFERYDDVRTQTATQDSQNNQFYDKGGNQTPERMTNHFERLEKQFNKGKK